LARRTFPKYQNLAFDPKDKRELLMIVYGAATDIGLARLENQDTYGVFPETTGDGDPAVRLFVVADGMGGHKGGKRASTLAVEAIGRIFFLEGNMNVQERLVEAFQAANASIHSTASRTSGLSGMGTTCVALAVEGNVVHVIHIGDSRAYRIKDRAITQLTEDHTLVAEMQRRGTLTAQEAEDHPEKSVLYRALGTKSMAEIDLHRDITVTGTEHFVLCCDGLTNMVQDNEILDVVTSLSPQEACEELVRLANDRGGYDNITVIVVRFSAQ
jgi:protein phosphatase